MSREISFRAFHKGRKEMYEVFSLAPDYVFKNTLDGIGNPGCPDATEEVVLMQYTGLIDKNGKKIYESDIVKWDDQSNGNYWRVAIVIWYNGGWAYKIVENTLHKLSTRKGYIFRNQSFIYSDGESLEVVGNIYETPEICS